MERNLTPTRRDFCVVTAAALAAPALVHAQAYPAKPVKIVVAYAPGGANDITARVYAQALGDRLKQSFVVENRVGASGITGTTFAAKSDPDGYTLLLVGGGPMTINPGLYPNLPYDPLKDFVSIGLASRSPLLMVVPTTLRVNTVAELIAYVKARPDGITFASPGAGTALHLAGELFQRQAGIKALHIPYKGSSPAITDLIAGRVDLMFDAMNTCLPFVRGGKLKALAVTTAQRSDQVPDVPTLQEFGLRDFDVSSWFGFFAPANTPRDVVALLASEVQKTAATSEIREKLTQIGLETISSTPEQLRTLVQREQVRWKEVIRGANVKAE